MNRRTRRNVKFKNTRDTGRQRESANGRKRAMLSEGQEGNKSSIYRCYDKASLLVGGLEGGGEKWKAAPFDSFSMHSKHCLDEIKWK